MSTLSIKPYFPFCRVRMTRQSVSTPGDFAWIQAEPDARFHPVCHVCGTPSRGTHSMTHRALQDLNIGAATVLINCRYRKIYCPKCQGIRVEDLDFFHPYQRVTKRLAQYIHELCRLLTLEEN